MHDNRRLIIIAVVVILALSAGARFYHLGTPKEYIFDEVYYAKDAKTILKGRVGPTEKAFPWEPGKEVSWPHPEWGKFLIAGGILLFGDNAVGWRFASALAGLAYAGRRLPAGAAARPRARLGAPGPGAGGSRHAGHRPVAHSHARHLRRPLDRALPAVHPALRAGRPPDALAGARGRRRRPRPGHQVVGRLRAAGVARAALPPEEPPRRRRRIPVRGRGRCEQGERRSRRSPCSSSSPSACTWPATGSTSPPGTRGRSGANCSARWLEFNFHLHATHTYASLAPTWIADYRPVWYYFVSKNEVVHGVVSIGNAFLWWTALACLLVLPFVALLPPKPRARHRAAARGHPVLPLVPYDADLVHVLHDAGRPTARRTCRHGDRRRERGRCAAARAPALGARRARGGACGQRTAPRAREAARVRRARRRAGASTRSTRPRLGAPPGARPVRRRPRAS